MAILKRDDFRMNRHRALRFLFGHDLFGKPLHTFPDHALGLVLQLANCCSMKAATKGGIAAAMSPRPRTRWIADNSGCFCRARLASIRARKVSAGMATLRMRISAIAAPALTQSQCGSAS